MSLNAFGLNLTIDVSSDHLMSGRIKSRVDWSVGWSFFSNFSINLSRLLQDDLLSRLLNLNHRLCNNLLNWLLDYSGLFLPATFLRSVFSSGEDFVHLLMM